MKYTEEMVTTAFDNYQECVTGFLTERGWVVNCWGEWGKGKDGVLTIDEAFHRECNVE